MRLMTKTAGAALFAVDSGLIGASGVQANPLPFISGQSFAHRLWADAAECADVFDRQSAQQLHGEPSGSDCW